MKVPAAAEMILPFAVLFGSMATFVDLTRKLELIAARAAGMSVWQFVAPPMLTALLIGIVSVAIYNPLSASMKMRSDQMEIELFGVPGSLRIDKGVWLRQHGVDGLAVMHAMSSAKGGTELYGVSVHVYAPKGGFLERIEAGKASLEPGVWVLTEAQLIAPGEPTRWVGSYMLATELTPEQVAAATTPPQGTPFWSLPEMTARTGEAGLDATGYRLQFQTLLARPLLLVAMVLVAASFSLQFLSIWRDREDRFRGRGRGLRDLYRHQSPVGSRRRWHDQPCRGRMVACACREHVGHGHFALFGGRLMAFARPGHGLRHVPGVPFRLFERLRVRARRLIDLINQTRD